MTPQFPFINVTIDITAAYAVSGAPRLTHALNMETGMTLCDRRPAHYTECKRRQGVTCEKCAAAMARWLPEPEPPREPRQPKAKVVRHAKPGRPKGSTSKKPVDPQIEQQLKESYGMARCWQLTEKGHAALAYWERVESQTQQNARADTRA